MDGCIWDIYRMEVTRNSRRNEKHSLTHADRPSTQSNKLTYAKGVTPFSGCGLSSANPTPNRGEPMKTRAFQTGILNRPQKGANRG